MHWKRMLSRKWSDSASNRTIDEELCKIHFTFSRVRQDELLTYKIQFRMR